MTKRTQVAGAILSNSLARLADISPPHMVVLTEETDWLLVGGDFADAIETVTEDPNVRPVLEDHELVEA